MLLSRDSPLWNDFLVSVMLGAMSVLEARELSHSFSGTKAILSGVNLTLERGRIYALMGANGAGKTTLFNVITGFIEPTSGDVFFHSIRITGFPPHVINRLGIGRTFQDLRLISKLTVLENVLLAMNDNPTQAWYLAAMPEFLFKSKLGVLKSRADKIIENCFLRDVENNLASDISYGQQKLLNLACCIANDAQLLLLDEPIAGINPNYSEKIIVLLETLKEAGKTILLIEHNTEFLQKIADHFYFLNGGRLKSYANFALLKEDGEVLKAYLNA